MKHYLGLYTFLFVCLYLLFINKSFAQAGQLDSTFGQGGIVTTVFNSTNHSSSINSTAIQNDGKIVAVGYSIEGNYGHFTVIRYNSNGSLDITFGINGIVITKVSGYGEVFNSVAIQDDGKIVACGYSFTSNSSATNFTNCVIVRYNSNGSLDNTFGFNGIAFLNDARDSFDGASSIAIQNDEKIVISGTFSNGIGSHDDFMIARFNSNGVLDDLFGLNGIVSEQFLTYRVHANSISLQNDGKIVVVGGTLGQNASSIVMERYNPNGTLDNTFGTNGFVVSNIGISSSYANSVTMQSDEKIIVAGYSISGSKSAFTIIRYNTNGTIDNTFGLNGSTITPIGNLNSAAYSLTKQNDGKLICVGFTNAQTSDFVVIRYDINGNLDDSFGEKGIAWPYIAGSSEVGNSVVIQADGKIIAGGSSSNPATKTTDAALVQFKSNGELDDTFGINGFITTKIKPSNCAALSSVIQNDGKVVAAGYNYNDFAIARYLQNGDLDITFGTNGIATTLVGKLDAAANALVQQSDGNLIAAGYSYNGVNRDYTLVRYKTNGFVDNTFGTNGIVTTQIGISDDEIKSVAMQSDNKIVAAGNSFNGANYDFSIARYDYTGTLDNTFGTDGKVITSFGSSGGGITSMLIQNDDKIIVVGNSYNSFALVRYNPNGDIDNTFGSNGIVTTEIGNVYDFPNSAALQNDGKILVAGYSSNGNDNDIAIVRYNTNGDLDNTFGTNGIVITPISSFDEYANSVAIQSDGKIVAAGYSDNENNSNFAIVRYNSSGDLDNSFGIAGIESLEIGGSSSYANAVEIQKDGNIVVIGSSDNQSNYSTFTLVRFIGNSLTSINDEKPITIPTSFSLEQNYPNPFNPTTTISYAIPTVADLNFASTTNVTLKVYDVLGKEITTLVNEASKPGVYQVTFNASNLTSGIYYYRLQYGKFNETKKLVLLK